MCGVAVDEAGLGYTFYATNHQCVWREQLARADIVARAQSLGMEDVARAAGVVELLRLLRDAIVTVEAEAAPLAPSLKFVVTEVCWHFCPQRLEAAAAEAFFKELSAQLYRHNAFLLHRIRLLERILEAKDQYITFLSENYRALNGDDLLQRYRTSSGSNAADKYSREAALLRAVASYRQPDLRPAVELTVADAAAARLASPAPRSLSLGQIPPLAPRATPSPPSPLPPATSKSSPIKKKRKIGGMSIGTRVRRPASQEMPPSSPREDS